MAASSIYQRARPGAVWLHQFAPEIHQGGDYIWSNSVSQADEQPRLAKYADDLGFQETRHVLYLNTDWGRASQNLFGEAAKANEAEIVDAEGYQPDEGFPFDAGSRTRRQAGRDHPDFLLCGWRAHRPADPFGQLERTPIVASGSVYSPKFIELAGDAANEVYTESNFFPGDTRPEVQAFVSKYKARYNEDPDDFNAVAYDTIILIAAVIDKYGPDRQAIRDGLAEIKDVPSVIYGKATFDPQTRRVAGARAVYLVVKDGKFVLWDGKHS